MNLNDYDTLVFDCDGVILNSNRIKTDAFRHAALPYGEDAAERLVTYHLANGGVSRHHKISYFLDELVPDGAGPSRDELLEAYAHHTRSGLLTCEVAPALAHLREKSVAKWAIVSGGAQDELRSVFTTRGLADFFDAGIYGSPDPKELILQRELAVGTICRPALFLGDSRYDHVAASGAGFDFIFISGWTEFSDWREYCAENRIPHVPSLSDLVF